MVTELFNLWNLVLTPHIQYHNEFCPIDLEGAKIC